MTTGSVSCWIFPVACLARLPSQQATHLLPLLRHHAARTRPQTAAGHVVVKLVRKDPLASQRSWSRRGPWFMRGMPTTRLEAVQVLRQNAKILCRKPHPEFGRVRASCVVPHACRGPSPAPELATTATLRHQTVLCTLGAARVLASCCTTALVVQHTCQSTAVTSTVPLSLRHNLLRALPACAAAPVLHQERV